MHAQHAYGAISAERACIPTVATAAGFEAIPQDGTQAEYVRIPHADGSLYSFPSGGDEEALVMLSDALPTGFECGVLDGHVKPGDTVAIVGAGPVGLRFC